MIASAATIDRNALAAEVLTSARQWAKSRIKGNHELAERCEDAATDAILWALGRYDGSRPWHKFVWSAIKQFVHGEIANHHRKVRHLPPRPILEPTDEPAAPPARTDARPALSLDAAQKLPPDLRDAVRLYYLDGHDLRDSALLCGISHEGFRKRLKAAAKRMGGKMPPKPSGRRRLLRG